MDFDLTYETASQIDSMFDRDLGCGCASCGSLALVRHGLLVREVRDIDLLLKGQVNDQALLDWVEKNGRWLDSNTPAAEARLAAKATLAAGHLRFLFEPRLTKNRKQAKGTHIKVEVFVPGRYPFKTEQGKDIIKFTLSEIGRDPRGGSMNMLSPEGCILWKLLMGRQADKDDLLVIRDLAFRSNRRLKLDDVEQQIVNFEGRYGKLLPVFHDVFRATEWIRNMSGDADGFGVPVSSSQAGAYR